MVDRISMVTYLNGMHIVSEPSGNYIKYSDYATLAAAARRLVEAVRWREEVREHYTLCLLMDESLDTDYYTDNDIEEVNLNSAGEYRAALAELEALLKEK